MKIRTKIVVQVVVTFLVTFFMSFLLLKIGSHIDLNNGWGRINTDFDVNYFTFFLAVIPALLLIWLWNVKKVSKARRLTIVGFVSLTIISMVSFSLTELIDLGRFDAGTLSYTKSETVDSATVIVETIFIMASIVLSLIYIKAVNLLTVKPVSKLKSIILIISSTILCLLLVLVSNWGLAYAEPSDGKAKTVEEYSPIFKQSLNIHQDYVNILKTNCTVAASDETESVSTSFDFLQNFEMIKNYHKYNAEVGYTYFAETDCFDKAGSLIEELEKQNFKVTYQVSSTENTDSCITSSDGNKMFTKMVDDQEIVSEEFPCNLEDYDQLHINVLNADLSFGILTIVLTKDFTYVSTTVVATDYLPLEEIPSTVGLEIDLYEHGYLY